MKMEIKCVTADEAFFVGYDQSVNIDVDSLIVSLWNKYVEYKGGDNKISLNNKEFFETSFNNAYDAAWAATLSDRWDWKDDFVCFNGEGYLTSFSHWDDEHSPIDIEKIDIAGLVRALQDLQNEKRYVNNISKAIHEALQE